MDVVRNAYALDVVAEPYVDVKKLGNKLEDSFGIFLEYSLEKSIGNSLWFT